MPYFGDQCRLLAAPAEWQTSRTFWPQVRHACNPPWNSTITSCVRCNPVPADICACTRSAATSVCWRREPNWRDCNSNRRH